MANPYEQFAQPAQNPYAKYAKDPTAQEDLERDPDLEEVSPGVWKRIGGGLDAAAQIATSIVAEPVAGLAGIAGAVLPGEQGQGADWVEGTRDALTWEAESELGQENMQDIASFLEPVGTAMANIETGAGEAVLDATGSEVLATAAHTAPTALLEVLGLGLLRKPSAAAKNAARAQERMRVDPDATPEDVARELIEPEVKTPEEIAEELRKRNDPDKLAADVQADPRIMEAAEELGIELNPSHYSTNEAYIRVEQAVKSQPNGSLAAREADAIERLGNRADELIGEMGGDLDRSLVDAQIRERVDTTIKDLETRAEHIYSVVNDHIPPATKINPKASSAYIEQRLEQLGGDVSGLSKAERMLHEVMNQDKPPTYARLDQLRRDVGAGFKNRGVFADDLTGNLDQVYQALIIDQSNAAKAMGVGADFAAGRKLVQQRKDIEAQAMKLFGREMNKSMLPKLTQAANGLTKGDVAQFRNLMEALPQNMRTKAAATMLNDLFTHGQRTGGSIGQGFARAYDALSRNAGAKRELFKYLPEYAQRRFDAIGTLSQGIYRAKALENTSRTARDILMALEAGTMARNIDSAMDTILGRMTFVPGPTRWFATGAKVAKGKVKEAFNRQKAADDLMSSRDFNAAIQKAAEGNIKEAEIMIKRSKAWQAYRDLLGEGTKKQILAAGIIPWLTSMPEQEEQPSGQ